MQHARVAPDCVKCVVTDSVVAGVIMIVLLHSDA